jgi:hypothetical protein
MVGSVTNLPFRPKTGLGGQKPCVESWESSESNSTLVPRAIDERWGVDRLRNIELNSRGITRGGELGRRFPSKLLFLLRSRFKVINSPFLPRESPRRIDQRFLTLIRG